MRGKGGSSRSRKRAPQWLVAHWKTVPEAPQSGSIEERAQCVLTMRANKQITKADVREFLVFDLVCASFPGEHFPPGPPKSVKRLLAVTLGLREEHEPGCWNYRRLERRGGREWGAVACASVFDWKHYQKTGKRISLRQLERMMREIGFKSSRSTLRKWRREAYYNWSVGVGLPPMK